MLFVILQLKMNFCVKLVLNRVHALQEKRVHHCQVLLQRPIPVSPLQHLLLTIRGPKTTRLLNQFAKIFLSILRPTLHSLCSHCCCSGSRPCCTRQHTSQVLHKSHSTNTACSCGRTLRRNRLRHCSNSPWSSVGLFKGCKKLQENAKQVTFSVSNPSVFWSSR